MDAPRRWTPGLGLSVASEWDVEGGHLAERCSLFIIIALGQSVLVTGATFAGLAWTPETVAAFLPSFAGSAAIWWIYFDTGSERGAAVIEASDNPGRLARRVYAYIHLPIVGGIIVSAVADALVLAHPMVTAKRDAIAILLGGPALYLAGDALFKQVMCERSPLMALALSALTLGTATSLILIIIAAWEWNSLRSKPA